MSTQVNVRLPQDLKRMAEKYAKQHGFRNVQDLMTTTLRDKIMEEESVKETAEIMKDRKLHRSILKAMEGVKAGRVYTWEELQEEWKKYHAKK